MDILKNNSNSQRKKKDYIKKGAREKNQKWSM